MVQILDQHGRPLAPSNRGRKLALNGYSETPYDAASSYSSELANWVPYLGSPDNEINIYRDRIVSRVRDLVRNDGWASGGVTRILDNAVGAVFRPIVKPDYRALAFYTGNKSFDATWADEYGRAVEAAFRTWSTAEGRYCDVERKLTVSQMFRLAFRHKLIDGDALAVLQFREDRVGRGRAHFATAIQIVDPDRLSNPQQQFDLEHIRGGVELDDDGAPVAYHIRKAHVGDWWAAADSMTWERVSRETSWGRPIVVHDFDHDRASQHRGTGIFTPVVQRLKMLVKYDATELESAVLNAIFGAYIESPYDPQLVEQAMGTSVEDIASYQDMRKDFHSDRRLTLGNGARMPIMFPGEKVVTVNAARPSSNFPAFESAVLRNTSSALGISESQLTQDWSKVNYSSARSALLEAWKTLTRRRVDFATGFAQPILGAFIEELHDTIDLPLPAGAPEFLECRTAYSRAQWMGPGRGWVDPVAEKKGAILGMDAGLSTLEIECSENVGEDWEDLLDQRAREIEALKERGLPLPAWAISQDAENTIQEPEEQ